MPKQLTGGRAHLRRIARISEAMDLRSAVQALEAGAENYEHAEHQARAFAPMIVAGILRGHMEALHDNGVDDYEIAAAFAFVRHARTTCLGGRAHAVIRTTQRPRPRGAGRPRGRVTRGASTAAASSGDDPGPPGPQRRAGRRDRQPIAAGVVA